MGRLIAVLLVAGAFMTTSCKDDGGEGAAQRFTLFWSEGQPPGGVTISVAVPAGWKVTTNPIGSPKFEVPGLGIPDVPAGPTITLTRCRDEDGARCLQGLAEYEADGAPITVEERAGGLWARQTRGTGGVHHRFYRQVAGRPEVVTCTVQLMARDRAHIEKLEAFCESVTLPAATP